MQAQPKGHSAPLPCTVSLPAQGRAALTLQQAEALSWPALEGKILASLAWGGNAFTASCFPQISDGQSQRLLKEERQSTACNGNPHFSFPFIHNSTQPCIFSFQAQASTVGSSLPPPAMQGHPGSTLRVSSVLQLPLALLQDAVRLQLETPRCVPAVSLAPQTGA